MLRGEMSESVSSNDFTVPESAPEGLVVLKEAYELRRKIETGEGEVSAEEYHSVFERVLSKIQDDHSQSKTTQEELVAELSELSRLQNEVSALVFERLKEARIDQLTGLPTADFFEAQAQEILNKQKEYIRDHETEFLTIAVFTDINELKPINDQIGHSAGNVALKAVAGKIKSMLREGDPVKHRESSLAGRVGGDEFVVIVDRVFKATDDPEILSRNVDQVIERFRRDLSMIDFEYDGETYSIGATVGFAYTTDFTRIGVEGLIREADNDMFFHKPQRR